MKKYWVFSIDLQEHEGAADTQVYLASDIDRLRTEGSGKVCVILDDMIMDYMDEDGDHETMGHYADRILSALFDEEGKNDGK